MAGEIWVVGNTSYFALASSSERALVSIVSTNDDIAIKEWSVWFDGQISSGNPVRVTLAKCTTVSDWSTATAYSQTMRFGSTGGTSRAIGLVIAAASTSTGLTSSGVVARRFVHPQVGYHEKFPMGQEPHIRNGEAIAIFVNSPTTVDALAELVYEE